MKKESYHIAVDIGKSGAKMALMSYNEKKIVLTQLIKFPVDNVNILGHEYVNIYEIYKNIISGVISLSKIHYPDSLGIDSWGSDYGLIGKEGELLGNVYFHRDRRTIRILEKIYKILNPYDLFYLTGGDLIRQYIFPQLYAETLQNKDLLSTAKKLLFIPDLLIYFLTRTMGADNTMAGASQLLDINKKEWNKKLFELFNMPLNIMPDIYYAGTKRGVINNDIKEEYGLKNIEVIGIAGHDSASAVAALYDFTDRDVFISAGSTITLGTETKEPVLNDMAQSYRFRNLSGVMGTNLFYKDLNGFWIINECINTWRTSGSKVDFGELEKKAEEESINSIIDTDDPSITECQGNMPKAVQDYCFRTGQKVPVDEVQIFTCVIKSLVIKIAECIELLERTIDRKTDNIYMISGGSQSNLFACMIAKKLNKKVKTGQMYSTLYGNVLMQIVSQTGINSLSEARKLMKESYDYKKY